MALDTQGLKPLDTTGLSPASEAGGGALDTSNLKPLDTSGLRPAEREEGRGEPSMMAGPGIAGIPGREPQGEPPEADEELGRLGSAGSSFMRGAGQTAAGIPKGIALVSAPGPEVWDNLDRIDAGNPPIHRTVSPGGTAGIAGITADVDTELYRQYAEASPEERREIRDALNERARASTSESELYQLGNDIDAWFRENFPTNPEFRDEFWSAKVPHALGSATTFVISSAVSRGALRPLGRRIQQVGTYAAPAATGAGINSAELFEDALANGAEISTALEAAGWGRLFGLSEAVPIGNLFNRMDRVGGGQIRRYLSRAMRQGTEEAVQEAFVGVMNDATAQGLYDPERGVWTMDRAEEGAVGFTTGAILETLMTLALPGRRRGAEIPTDERGVPEGAVPGETVIGREEPADAPMGERERARSETPPPMPGDVESPLPTDAIQEGRENIQDALGEQSASQILEGAGFPPISSRINLTTEDGARVEGTVVDAFEEGGVRGAKVQLDDGTVISEPFETLQGRVTPTGEAQDAEAVRGDTGPVEGARPERSRGEVAGRPDLQQPAQERPEARDQQAPEAQGRPAEPEEGVAGALPEGWTESQPGGLATSRQQGIVDRNIASGKWFAIPAREDAEPIEGFDTREEAIAALQSGESTEIETPAESATEAARAPISRRDVEGDQGRDTAVTATGRRVPVRYAVVEAGELVASQRDDGRANPDYPAELQPRDRSRAVSDTQISDILNPERFDPRILDRSPQASTGAPIVAEDGIVESGNGRILALRKAYREGREVGDTYRNYLAEQGYPVEGVDQPVLVRVREGEMEATERAAFTREANERDTLGMSATERAMADAAAMSDGMLDLYEGGDVDAAANRPFVRSFLDQIVGRNEQAGMIAADGSMSQEAVRRIEAALLAKAYGDADLVASLVESPDSNIKAIGGALMDVAAGWAQMRSDAKSGQIDSAMDQTERLLEAVRLIQRARREKRNVAEMVGQRDLMSGDALHPDAEAFLRLMFRNTRNWTQPAGREKLSEALKFYIDAAGRAQPGVDLLGQAAPEPARILETAKERQYGAEAAAEQQQDLLAQPEGSPGERVRPDGEGRAERPEPDAAQAGEPAPARTGEEGAGAEGQVGEARSQPVSIEEARREIEAAGGTVTSTGTRQASRPGENEPVETEFFRVELQQADGTTVVMNNISFPVLRMDLDRWLEIPNRTGSPAGLDALASARPQEQTQAPTEQERRDQAQHDIYARRIDEIEDPAELRAYAEELRTALMTDERTGLGSNRAWLNRTPKAHIASIDLDSLKWINDNMGHDAGDRMIEVVGDAFREAGIADDSFHVSGDEFYAHSEDEQRLRDAMDRAREYLRGITVEGNGLQFTGPGFSYGLGTNIERAEEALHGEKTAREEAGERAARGERPRGVAEAAQAAEQEPAPRDREEAPEARPRERAERPEPRVAPETGRALRPQTPQELVDDSDLLETTRANIAGETPERAALIVLRDMLEAGTDVMNDAQLPSEINAPAADLIRRINAALESSQNLDAIQQESVGMVREWLGRGDVPADIARELEGIESVIEAQMALPAAEQPGQIEAQDSDPETRRLADHFTRAFSDGRSFRSITEARREAGEVLDRTVEPGTQDAKRVDEAVELGVVLRAREIAREEAGNPQQAYGRLVDLYGSMPNLSTRTSTSIAQQAYSTPVPLAYLAARSAGITDRTLVYEPTAGNGALLVTADPANVLANELNPERAANLQDTLPGASVTSNNAAEWSPQGRYDVVIANPPFGPVKDEGGRTRRFQVNERYETAEIDHAIAMNALESMRDDGSAVLLVGSVAKTARSEDARSDAYNGKAKREFYLTLYGDYNVVDHFTVAGELYEKQGAGWPVDVIVIRGRGPSERRVPAADPPRVYESWDDLGEVLDAEYPSPSPVARTADRGRDRGERESRPGDGRDRADRGAARPDRERGEPAPGERTGVREGPVARQPGDTRPSEPAARERARPAEGERPAQRPRRDPVTVEGENLRQVAYQPSSTTTSMGTLVPVNMQTAVQNAHDRLRERVGDIDHYVATRLNYRPDELSRYFGAEQIDAIALALDNMEKGAGFIIGDQTGIGKGRVVAAVIRHALIQGKTPIFVTEKPNLYGDMYRDLADIGVPDMLGQAPRILMTNAAQTVPLDEQGNTLKTGSAANHNQLLSSMAASGRLEGYDMVFTTYSQMQTLRGETTPRMQFLEAMDRDGIVIFDESHNAGGSSQPGAAEERGGEQEMNRAVFARNLARSASGVLYSSATYAKRPEVMDLYATTDMRLAVSDINNLAEAIQKGGVPMQQVVASMLSESGQYLRRERSFDGVVYNAPVVNVPRQTYGEYSQALAAIQKFSEKWITSVVKGLDKELKAEGKALSTDGATGGAGAASTNFTSIMHNLIDQMLLSIKADVAAEKAIAAIGNGEKPVITVANTMGAFIHDYVEDLGIKPGDRVDLTFNSLLERYLIRTRWISVRRPFMKKGEKAERKYLTDADLGPAAVRAFEQVREQIRNMDLSGLPVSPIDHVRMRLQQAGHKVGEITGRTATLDYRPDGTYYRSRPGKEVSIAGRRKAIADFNGGAIDAMIINQAGSTGLSLHASETFKDQRKRRMILAQAEKNIDTHMQMLGRVHRTGQVVTPEYDQLVADVPAEKRPAAVLAKKMASLNANTTASRGGALMAEDVPDFMNQYGDEVAARIMADMPEIHQALGTPLKDAPDGFETTDAMRKVTGRIPLLPIEQQEMVYEMLESEYRAILEQKEAAGESVLEAKTLDLDADIQDRRQVVAPESGNSPFADGVYVEAADVKRLGKPYPTDRVIEIVAEELGIDASTVSADNMDAAVRAGREAAERMRGETEESFRAYRRQTLDDLENEATRRATENRLDGNMDRFRSILRTTPVGTSVRLLTDAGNLYGVVTRIHRTGRAQNPVALGSWKVTVAVTDASRQITIPMSQLFTRETAPSEPGESQVIIERADNLLEGMPIIRAFDDMQTEARETRTIITGNILAGFDHVGERGAIINFTDREGGVRQGILMPRDYEYEKQQQERPVDFRSAEQVMAFVNRGHTAKSADRAIQVTLSDGQVRFEVSASKALGGRYYLDPGILSAAGQDFVKVGTRMRADVSPDVAPSVLDEMKRAGAGFRATDNLNEAREIAGSVSGETQGQFSIRDEGGDNVVPFRGRRRSAPTGADVEGRPAAPEPVTMTDELSSIIQDGRRAYAHWQRLDRQWQTSIGNADSPSRFMNEPANDAMRQRVEAASDAVAEARDRLIEAVEPGYFDAPGLANEYTPGAIELFGEEARPLEALTKVRDVAAERAPQDDQFSLRLRDDFERDAEQVTTDLQARLQQLGIADRVALRLRERIQAVAEGKASEADGRYLRGVIEIALTAPDATRILNHEVIHALRDLGLIRGAEWRTLERAARADADRMEGIRQRYERIGLSEEAMVEEAVADMYADWAAARSETGGFMRRAFERIRDFLRALGNALTGRGYRTADSVFRSVERGEAGRRQPRDARGRFTADTSTVREPGARFALSDPKVNDPMAKDGSVARQKATSQWIGSQPLDQAMRLPFHIFGGINEHGEWKWGKTFHKRAEHAIVNAKFSEEGRFHWINPTLERARAGLIDRYGLDPVYVERERQRGLEQRHLMLQAEETMRTLQEADIGPEEAKVLQAVLTGEAVADADMAVLSEPIRNAIDDMGTEAVNLGLISAEAFERNRGAYLHRVYLKHETDQGGLSRFVARMGSRQRKKIIGNQFKGRGLWIEVNRDRLMRNIPGFRQAERGGAVVGERFRVLDKVEHEGQGTLRDIDPASQRKVLDRIYLPADAEVPQQLGDYVDRGLWEVRGTQGGNMVLWRDFTKAERESMGEIVDARYTIAKTYMVMAHDLSTGRFFRDIAMNEDWARSSEPRADTWKDAQEYSRFWADPDIEWVRVPDTVIPKSRTKRYGALSGKWVRAEIWRDLHELENMQKANWWNTLLTSWKINKTARSPVVHMNNVMSNIVLMDLADVRAVDLVQGIVSMIRQDQHYQDARDHGAFGSDMVSQELRKNVLQPILEEIQRDVQGGQDTIESKVGLVGKLADAIWSRTKSLDRKMVSLYQLEDEVFRMATYMRKLSLGFEPNQAALEARDQFLNYDIRAPWVNAARRSALPFISYTYRAVPKVAESLSLRPWKLAKLATIGYAASALAYMIEPGDEDEERRSMREQETGYTWIGAPRMIRMPYSDEYGNPVFLDVRRWVPAGDVFDMNQGHSALPIPAPLQFGGPIMLGFEFALNKQAFTGDEITNDRTQDWWDKTAAVADWGWKSWMPSAAWIPGSWYWERIGNAATGGRDWQGRPYALREAIPSAFGVKLKPQDVEENFFWKGREFDRVERELKAELRRAHRDHDRNLISGSDLEKQEHKIMRKLENLARERQRTFEGTER